VSPALPGPKLTCSSRSSYLTTFPGPGAWNPARISPPGGVPPFRIDEASGFGSALVFWTAPPARVDGAHGSLGRPAEHAHEIGGAEVGRRFGQSMTSIPAGP
jgi:hypothetical protein